MYYFIIWRSGFFFNLKKINYFRLRELKTQRLEVVNESALKTHGISCHGYEWIILICFNFGDF